MGTLPRDAPVLQTLTTSQWLAWQSENVLLNDIYVSQPEGDTLWRWDTIPSLWHMH